MSQRVLDLVQLSCFVAAAEEAHFGRAAARLNVTQPTLSRQIMALEHALKVQLFERSNKSTKLTSAGRIFLPEAKRILALAESAANLTQRTWRGETGVIRLSYTTSAAIIDLPLILKQAAAVLPDVKIMLCESSSAEQKEALLANMLDVGILRPPIDRVKFRAITMRNENFIAALHKDDPRTKKGKLTLQDFDGQNFIMYCANGASYSYRMLTALFDQARVTPIMVQHVEHNHAILSLVSAGMGAALVPDSLSILAVPDVVFRKVHIGVPHSPLEMHMLWRPQNENPVLSPFVELCKTLFSRPPYTQKTHRVVAKTN